MTRRRFPGGASSALLSLLIGSAASVAGVAHAQGAETSAADTAAARSLAVDGVKLAQAGKCDDAVDKLERAEKLHHAPIVLANLGECRVTQGHLVDGTEMLRRVLREPLPDHPSPTLSKAYEHAQATLDATTPKIGRLTISLTGQGDAQPTVTVDGEPVSAALLGADRPTDPGEHAVEATATGFLKATAKVTLGEGERKSIKLDLEHDPAYVAPAAVEEAPRAAPVESAPAPARPMPTAASVDTDTPPPVHSSANHTAAYVSWIVGGAALAVGGGFGIAAMSGKSDLDKQCNGNACPAAAQSKLDAARRNGTIATIGFGVGAAGVALGTVLLFTVGGSSDSAASASAASKPHHAAGPKLQASIGLGNVQLAGSF
ncbi:MAG TPA: hypothetical protein VH062_05715 [Polyangiaceae bacterium]|jgi:hypothetical protein|nr:hypothetical protein [Polyangiaceae bacterium]